MLNSCCQVLSAFGITNSSCTSFRSAKLSRIFFHVILFTTSHAFCENNNKPNDTALIIITLTKLNSYISLIAQLTKGFIIKQRTLRTCMIVVVTKPVCSPGSLWYGLLAPNTPQELMKSAYVIFASLVQSGIMGKTCWALVHIRHYAALYKKDKILQTFLLWNNLYY